MEAAVAKNRIRETFEHPFNKTLFAAFTRNLLKSYESKTFSYQGIQIQVAYQEFIQSYERIGKYFDSEGKEIDILVVNLKKGHSLDRARSMQRNFVARYLNGGRDPSQLRDAALVAFVAPDSSDWRFSLVKMDYQLEETLTGKVKVKTDLTPARRWSFRVGEFESSHTAQSRFVDMLVDDDSHPTLASLETAFNVEVVTREFFEKYRGLFVDVKEAVDHVLDIDQAVRDDFAAKNINTSDFAKKLLGQIVFLYFLQKKGWFGVARDQHWGSGPRNFLRRLFEKKHAVYNNFFNDILEPLFYEALAKERDGDFYSRFNCKIPFLNGGLFDPLNGYEWVHTDILLPDQLFSNGLKTKEGDIGSGILDIFDRYNFTVKEDEPLEKEVAVDPEMLGKVFENLLEVKDRKSKGTYYTPREIVHYMCQEALINYLDTSVNAGAVALGKEQPMNLKLFGAPATQQMALKTPGYTGRIPRQDIEEFIRKGELTVEHDTHGQEILNQGKKSDVYVPRLDATIRENTALLDAKLADIRVCDPAVGSGAFLVGMMNELVRARSTLNINLSQSGRSRYDFKRHAIHECLYGVDIDPGAVEIAKLRLWLSLVVDEDDFKEVKPLPNLDYKIVCGNSLLGVERNMFNNVLFDELEKLIPQHIDETSTKKKLELKKRIDQLIKELTDDKKTFDFEVYFSGVFHQKGGFDVVIANPPYGVDFSDSEKDILKRKYDHISERIRNSYLYFMGLSYDIVKLKGVISLILPNEFLFQIYMTKARKFFLTKTQVLYAVNAGSDVFEAIVPSCIVAFKKHSLETYDLPVEDLRSCSLADMPRYLKQDSYKKSTKDIILATPNAMFTFNLERTKLVSKLTGKFPQLDSICSDIANGICTSCDSVYIVKNEIARSLHLEADYMKPCIRGGQFKRYWCPSETNESIIYFTGQIDLRQIKNIHTYLVKNKELLVSKSVEKNNGTRNWAVLFRPRDESLFIKPKILIRQTSDSIVAAIDDRVGYYCINSVNVMTIKPLYIGQISFLLALLNSSVMRFYYREISQEKGRILAEVKPQRLKMLPIPNASESQQKAIEILSNQIILSKKQHSGALLFCLV